MPEGFHTLDPRLRPFLLAPLWEERNEMPLSLLSAFARLDLDPWLEAAALAELPRERAVSRLGDLLTRMSGAPSRRDDLMRLCEPLIARLPAASASTGSSAALRPPVALRERLLITIICSALVLHAALVIVSAHPPPASTREATRAAAFHPSAERPTAGAALGAPPSSTR